MTIRYRNPNTTPSTMGTQHITQYYYKKALISAKKEMYFSPLADVRSMPKHFGKKIVQYLYVPLLDERNINDQGLDAAGAVLDISRHYVTLPRTTMTFVDTTAATTAANAINAIQAGVATVTGANVTVTKTNLIGATLAQADAVLAAVGGAVRVQGSGNLYGGAKDVGVIPGKMPLLSETGGKVNRVGFTRLTLEGTFRNFGFYYEYTEDSLQFDTDEELEEHVSREAIRGANQIVEDNIQIDLLNSAGTVVYAGTATTNATVSDTSRLTYRKILDLSLKLDDVDTPKQTTIMTGTRMQDTVTIPSARVAFIGSELVPTLRGMKDLHNSPAFIPVQKYAAGTTVLNGEIGMIDQLRFVQVPRMFSWKGAGAAHNGSTVRVTAGQVDVYPVLVVGDESFTTIGFQTSGKTVKFDLINKKPGRETAAIDNPYGKLGFASIQWWYGFMALRPERIGLIRTAADI